MRIESNLKEWLEANPNPDDIREKDGAKYIPYHIIVDKLNHLTGGNWSTGNFVFHTCSLPDRRIMVTGSIDVVVEFHYPTLIRCEGDQEIIEESRYVKRVLAGAATFLLSKNGNPHPAASVKSLAIMNAVKPLGPQFGWGLNGFETESTYFPDEEEVPTIQLQESPETKRWQAIVDSCFSLTELEKWRLKCPQEIFNNRFSQLKDSVTKN
jgi:hypothetical protein